MKAAILEKITSIKENKQPLKIVELPLPEVHAGEILLKISTCGVCHTELDEIEGRTPPAKLPCIPGHQIIGTVIARGDGATKFATGERAGIGWINHSCGHCEYCLAGMENLCPDFLATVP